MGVIIEMRRAPKMGTTAFRLFTIPQCVLTHYDGHDTTLCIGVEKCKRHIKPVLKGFSAAYEWQEEASAWLPVVLEWTEGMIQSIGLDFNFGDVWELSRMHVGKTPNAVVSNFLGAVPIAPGTKPWDVRSIVERFFREKNAAWGISPDYMLRVEGDQDDASRPPGTEKPIKADAERASPEVMLSFRNKLKEASQGVGKAVQ